MPHYLKLRKNELINKTKCQICIDTSFFSDKIAARRMNTRRRRGGLAANRQTTNAWRFRAQSSPPPKCPLGLGVG